MDAHRPNQQQQQAYTRPTSHQSTPAKGAIPSTSSPSYGRTQAHNGRHASPAIEKRTARNVRYGLWSRRGDHLTEDGYVVYCPPGRNFQEISLTILKTRLWTIQAKSSTRSLVHIQNIQIQYHLEQGLPVKPYDAVRIDLFEA